MEKQKEKSAAKREGWITTRAERACYSSYMVGQNIIYTLVSNFLTTYLLLSSIDPIKSATVILLVKIWDAVNDIFFGVIFDKVKFKGNKRFLPWLRISLIFIPLTTVMIYGIPGSFSESGRIIWFAVAYILWDSAYTLCDIPIYGIVTTMSANIQERTSILSVSRIFSGVGTVIAYVLGTVLVSQKVGLSYTVTSVICSVLALLFMTPICIRGKERNYNSEEHQDFGIAEMFRYLFSNKYLLIFYTAFMVRGCLSTAESLNMLVCYYLFNNEMFSLMLQAVSYLPLLIFVPFVNKILARFDKAMLFTVTTAILAAVYLVQYLVGYENVTVFIILTILKGVPSGLNALLLFMFTPDCAEYGKYKSGTDAKGITFAIQTFSAKLTGSVATSLGVFIIGWFGWQKVNAASFAELAEMGATQTSRALHGLWIAYTLIPAVGYALGFVILLSYKLRDKDVQVMTECNSGIITREQAEERLSRQY